MKPAISFAAMPGRRQATLELAQEIERRGFSGLYCPSFGDGVGLCGALALSTETILFGTSIANIYTRHAYDYAQTAALVHELSGGRFRFGVGVSHAPANARFGVQAGKPVADMRKFVADLRTGAQRSGDLPPIVLATLRKPMIRLASEIAEGAVWANASRSYMATSLSFLKPEQRTGDSFFIGNMIPTCVSDDRAAAAAVMRKMLRMYVMLPNYQNYWIDAGYEEEMCSIQKALAAGERDRIADLMPERWLRDVTLFGSSSEVREGFEAWLAAGVTTPMLVPSSTSGGQFKAIEELLSTFV